MVSTQRIEKLAERLDKVKEDSRLVEQRLQEELEKLKKTCDTLQEQALARRYTNGNGH